MCMESSLQEELKGLFKAFEETKDGNKKLSEFNALLQEELQLAREAERTAEHKKIRCEAFLNQQQEIIHGLLAVKEENENLKHMLNQTEKTLTLVQNNNIEGQMRHDAKLQELEQEYLKKIVRVHEEANQQAEKEKSECLDTIIELKTTVSKLEEKLAEKDTEIISLHEKVETLKAWSDANLEALHEKLTQEKKKHQSELEAWRMAEVNKSLHNNSVHLYGFPQNQYYQPSQAMRLTQGYQYNARFPEQMSGYQKIPLVSHYKTTPCSHNLNMVRPLTIFNNYQNKSDFVSAADLMKGQQTVGCDGEEKDEERDNAEKIKENEPVEASKPNIAVPNKKRKLFNSTQNIL